MDTVAKVFKPLLELSWEGAKPFYATAYSAGFDIVCTHAVNLKPGERCLASTGLRIIGNHPPLEMSFGEGQKVLMVPELQLRPRSGLALKYGLTLLNSPSTIDADYRGEIKLILINHGQETCHLHAGERVAQAVCQLAIHLPTICNTQSVRGGGGFGSTGI